MSEEGAANPGDIPRLVGDRDAKQVQAEIEAKYGFRATLDYCRDLIGFVDAMLAGEPTGAGTDADARD